MGEFLTGGGELIEVQGVTRHRADEIGAAVFERALEGVGVGDVVFVEVVKKGLDGDREAAIGDQAPFIEGVFARMIEGNEGVILGKIRISECACPADGFDSGITRPLERGDHGLHLFFARCFVKAADLDVDGMDLAPTKEGHDLIADFFHLQAAFNDAAVIFGHRDGAIVAEKIGCVEHIDVQDVAFDPFAAVQESAKLADRRGDLDAQRLFHRVASAHLIGDGADPADPRRNIGGFAKVATAQEAFKEARWFKYPQLGLNDALSLCFEVERAFAFDTRKNIHFDSAATQAFSPFAADKMARSIRSLSARKAGSQALKVR